MEVDEAWARSLVRDQPPVVHLIWELDPARTLVVQIIGTLVNALGQLLDVEVVTLALAFEDLVPANLGVAAAELTFLEVAHGHARVWEPVVGPDIVELVSLEIENGSVLPNLFGLAWQRHAEQRQRLLDEPGDHSFLTTPA